MASRYHFAKQGQNLGGQLGAALGTGLGGGLTALAEAKLNSMLSRQRQAADKQKLVSLGIPDHEAQFLSHQDPDTQWQGARAWLIANGAPADMMPKNLGEQWNISPEQEAQGRQTLQEAGILHPEQEMAQEQPGMPQEGALQTLQGMQHPAPQQGAAMQALGAQPQAQPQQLGVPSALQQSSQPRRPSGLGEAFRIEQELKGKKTSSSKLNDAATKRAESAIDTADQMESLVDEMEELIATGKVATGFKGAVLPTWYQNTETQRFETAANELAGLKAAKSGVATNFKIKFNQTTKPNISQTKNTQLALLKRTRNEALELRNKAESRLAGRELPHQQPENKQAKRFESLPDASQYPNKKIRNPETGETLMSDGKEWKKV